MDFFVECLGASREVGRSAFLVHTDKKIIADYGIKLFDESGTAKFPLETQFIPDFAVISHSHMDHIGCVPALFKDNNKMRWYSTPPTKEISEIMWLDSMKIMGDGLPYRLSHLNKALKYWTPLMYERPIQTGETKITFYDAGHISGSAMTDFTYKGKRFLYTGDFKGQDTAMHKGVDFREEVDYLMIESTYALKEHPDRKETEKKFMEDVRKTVEGGGNVLLPSFGLGRTQELLSIIRGYDENIPVYVDGMGREITKIYLRYPTYIKNPKGLKRAMDTVTMIKTIPEKKEATRRPSVIISTAGMLNGGPALNYLFNMNNKSKIIFTGYCVEHTNGWKLQNHGYITQNEEDLYVDLPVAYYNLSAHAGRSDILNFIERTNPQKILLVHRDKAQDFARE